MKKKGKWMKEWGDEKEKVKQKNTKSEKEEQS